MEFYKELGKKLKEHHEQIVEKATPDIGANGNWFIDGKDTGIRAVYQSKTDIKTLTLFASDWADNQQVVVCDGISADEAKQNITISPALENESLYQDSRVTCISFAENQLTFAAESVPAEDLTVYVAMEQAGEPVMNNVYSTEETVIGTWIDGKPLYRTVFVATMPTTNTDLVWVFSEIDASDKHIDDIAHIGGTTHFGTAIGPAIGATTDGHTVYVFYNRSNAKVTVRHNNVWWNGGAIRIVLEYTKTTDTATIAIPSATALMDAYEEGVNEA